MITSVAPAPLPRSTRPGKLFVLPILFCLIALTACHQAFGTGPHGGPSIGPAGAGVLSNIRVAPHPGFDRVVFDFTGNGVPDYNVAYVDGADLREELPDGGSFLVPVDGTYYLSLILGGNNLGSKPERTPHFSEIR